MTDTRTIVIVGASLAGVKAAEGLRTRGFEGRVVLIGDEPDHPYQRPPLTKGYLSGKADLDDVFLHQPGWYDEQSIELRTSTKVTAIDPVAHQVTLAGGAVVDYDRLLLATGSRPRHLELMGADLPGVHYLRTLGDTERLKAAAGKANAVAVVGAGWIGAEAAASLRELGLPVTMLDVTTVPLERVLGTEIGSVYRDLHAERGVTLRMGTSIASFRGNGHVEEVRTTDGESIAADLVVVGVGATPRTELAEEAGLKVDNGVLVDEHLLTSAPDVYAAGDIASAWHPLFEQHIRVEHWANALNQGLVVAANLLDDPTPYERVPYFFSDQYDLGMEYSGHAPTWDKVVFRGDPASREFIAFWLSDGVVVAGMNANVWDVNEPIQQLVRQRAKVDPDRLADSAVPLEVLSDQPG